MLHPEEDSRAGARRPGDDAPAPAPPSAAKRLPSEPRPAARRAAQKVASGGELRGGRAVVCTWCNAPTQVATSAQSVVCPHCNKRLVIEDFRTASYHAVRLLATCGDVFVDKRGHVVAAVRAANLTVEGKLTGNVIAGGCVSLGKSAIVKGDIDAPRLRVDSGAMLNGFLRIGAPPARAAATAD